MNGIMKKHLRWSKSSSDKLLPVPNLQVGWKHTGCFKEFSIERLPTKVSGAKEYTFYIDKELQNQLNQGPVQEGRKRKRESKPFRIQVLDDQWQRVYAKASISCNSAGIAIMGPQRVIPVLAASVATEADEKLAKEKRATGFHPVVMPKRPYRPKMPNIYQEPDFMPDAASGLDVLFEEFGNVVHKNQNELPPRDDIIIFDTEVHESILQNNLQWRDCPEGSKEAIVEILKDYWDVFDPAGLPRHIRGYEFNVDTGNSPPVCAKQRRYGVHESFHIERHAKTLRDKGITESDWGPYGALCVLAAKPGQEHLEWHEYVFRFCVDYRALNAQTRPFVFPTRRCDDAIESVYGNFRIQMDLDSGYWQVKLGDHSKEKTAFFLPRSKDHWLAMPMGLTNAHPFFVCMMQMFQSQWNDKRDEQHITQADSEVIVDDVMLHAIQEVMLLAYFRCCLEVLQFHRVTVKLRKCRFLSGDTEFAGVDITNEGNKPAKSKEESFANMSRPTNWTDLRTLIGMFGFYQEWIPLYEFRIAPWRQMLKLYAGKPGIVEKRIEAIQIDAVWRQEDDCILQELKGEVLSEPCLQRPNPTKRYYIKTDWCKDGMAGVLLQRDDSPESEAAEEQEKKGGKCEFELTLTGPLRLHPIKFISRRTTANEHSWHSYIGEAAAATYMIEKFKHYVWGTEFTLMGDMWSMRYFMETQDLPTHMANRWRQQLLRFFFIVVHRPAKMVQEVDALSRYNNWTEQWRIDDAETRKKEQGDSIPGLFAIPVDHEEPTTLGFSNVPVMIAGPADAPLSESVAAVNTARTVWIVNAGASTVETALDYIGIHAEVSVKIETDNEWIAQVNDDDLIPLQEMIQRTKLAESPELVDWIVIAEPRDVSECDGQAIMELVYWSVRRRLLRAAVIFIPVTPRERREEHSKPPLRVLEWEKQVSDALHWSVVYFRVENTNLAGFIQSDHWVIITTPSEEVIERLEMPSEPIPSIQAIQEHLDPSSSPIDDYIWPQDLQQLRYLECDEKKGPDLHKPRVSMEFADTSSTPSRPIPVFDIEHPAPRLTSTEFHALNSAFVIAMDDDIYGTTIRGIRPIELLSLYGFDEEEKTYTGVPE